MLEACDRYIKGVMSGEVVACSFVKKAVQRHVADLEKKDWPYVFDVGMAKLAVGFFKLLRHTKGEHGGKHFGLLDSQVFILSVLFGWRRKADNKRRFRKAYIEMARKNGKSELAAGILLYLLIMDSEQVGENYSAATTRDQARIVFKSAKIMAEYLRKDHEGMARDIQILAHSIVYRPTGGHIQALSAEADTLDGLNPHGAVVDEYHEHKTNDVLGVIQTGTGSRAQPLIVVITTAGFNQAGPCYTEERKVAVEVLEGTTFEETLFAIVFTIDEGDGWDDPEVWAKANPHLGVTPLVQYMESALKEAKNKGGRYITHFMTKNLNVWTDAPEVWIPDENWRTNDVKFDLESLEGRFCFGGLDLASVSDITSLCLLFPGAGPDGRNVFLWRNWLPSETVEKRSGRVNYGLWEQQEWLDTTPGNVTDYDYIRIVMREQMERFNIHTIFYDRYNSHDIIPRLLDDGLPMQPFGQGFLSMSTPSKEFERMVLSSECAFGGNPVARWSNGNVVLSRDASGNIKPDKGKSSEKIDPIVSAVMAVGAWLTHRGSRVGASYLFEDDLIMI
jgi:phage terminase large subunit-like protein